MRKFFVRFLERLVMVLGEEKEAVCQPESQPAFPQEATQEIIVATAEKQVRKKEKPKIKKTGIGQSVVVAEGPKDMRDIMVLMEIPFVSLSKNRTAPIVYESKDGTSKVNISCHTGHYLASIYDWDIILLVSSKLQETINNSSDVPPRTLIISRSDLLKALYKHDGKTNKKELEASLARLQLTGIETTIHNEDYRYRAGFGFLDSWRYTGRKDIKEFSITLSEWLYEITCCKGSLLKVDPRYFELTSGLKRFLYRTARKHVGVQNEGWKFTVQTLYEKSGSERAFKKFKHDLKKAVIDNDIPSYALEWMGGSGKETVIFTNKKEPIKKVEKTHSTTIIEEGEFKYPSPRNLLN